MKALNNTTHFLLSKFSKKEPIKRIDETFLESNNTHLPFVHLSNDELYMLDHHRIWAANLLEIPIEVLFTDMSTFN